jgi:hypothetical protein
VAKELRVKLLFLFWRVWHHRNDIVRGDGKASIEASVPFLQNYIQAFAEKIHGIHSSKGKSILFPSQNNASMQCEEKSEWQPPPKGGYLANVDAGWDVQIKKAGIGVVLRDETGAVIVSEWKHLPLCASAEEAEARACLDGLHHIIKMQRWPGIVESDCMRVIYASLPEVLDRSPSWCLY